MSTNWRAREQDLIEGVQIKHVYENEGINEQVFEDAQDIIGQAYVGTLEYGTHDFTAVKRKEYGKNSEYKIAWPTDKDVLGATELLDEIGAGENVDLFFLSEPYTGRKQISDIGRKSDYLEFETGEHQVVDINAIRMYLDDSSALCWSEQDGANEFYFVGQTFNKQVPEAIAADLNVSSAEATELYETLEDRLTSHEF